MRYKTKDLYVVVISKLDKIKKYDDETEELISTPVQDIFFAKHDAYEYILLRKGISVKESKYFAAERDYFAKEAIPFNLFFNGFDAKSMISHKKLLKLEHIASRSYKEGLKIEAEQQKLKKKKPSMKNDVKTTLKIGLQSLTENEKMLKN